MSYTVSKADYELLQTLKQKRQYSEQQSLKENYARQFKRKIKAAFPGFAVSYPDLGFYTHSNIEGYLEFVVEKDDLCFSIRVCSYDSSHPAYYLLNDCLFEKTLGTHIDELGPCESLENLKADIVNLLEFASEEFKREYDALTNVFSPLKLDVVLE